MEVDIFSEWEDLIMARVKPPPVQLNFLSYFRGGDTWYMANFTKDMETFLLGLMDDYENEEEEEE